MHCTTFAQLLHNLGIFAQPMHNRRRAAVVQLCKLHNRAFLAVLGLKTLTINRLTF